MRLPGPSSRRLGNGEQFLETDFGFCAYDDAPAAIGGGTPCFFWFATKEEMLGALRRLLNKHLRGSSQFTWIGSFKELCEGDHPAAQELRADFREDSNGTVATPI